MILRIFSIYLTYKGLIDRKLVEYLLTVPHHHPEASEVTYRPKGKMNLEKA